MKAGITGHQSLGSTDTISWLIETLTLEIKQKNIERGLTSLAIGADQLFAEVLRDAHIPYVAVIPCDKYEQTFTTSNDLERYSSLLQRAVERVNLPFDKPTEIAFYEAGKKIVDNSDIMIAIWNGQPARGLGGTGDIVKYALSMKKKVLHINPINRTVNRM